MSSIPYPDVCIKEGADGVTDCQLRERLGQPSADEY